MSRRRTEHDKHRRQDVGESHLHCLLRQRFLVHRVVNARRELIDVLEHVLQDAFSVNSRAPAGKTTFVKQLHLQQHWRRRVGKTRRSM